MPKIISDEKQVTITRLLLFDNLEFRGLYATAKHPSHCIFHILTDAATIWRYAPHNIIFCGERISNEWGRRGNLVYNTWTPDPKGRHVLSPGITVPNFDTEFDTVFDTEINNLKRQLKQLEDQNKVTQIKIEGLNELTQAINNLIQIQTGQIHTIQEPKKKQDQKGRSLMKALKATMAVAKTAGIRGAKVASSKEIADLMVQGTRKLAGDAYPKTLSDTEVGQALEPFLVAFGAHFVTELYPESIPKADLVRAVASYAMEGTSHDATKSLLDVFKPAFANFAELATKIPAAALGEEETKMLEANGKKLTSQDIKKEIESLNQMKAELERRQEVLLQKQPDKT
jgi:hypothetical protein